MRHDIRERIKAAPLATPAAAPAPPPGKRRARPDCIRSLRISARCDVCHDLPAEVHCPMRVTGFYCERCCPCCSGEEK